jgi:hypothetical protein
MDEIGLSRLVSSRLVSHRPLCKGPFEGDDVFL